MRLECPEVEQWAQWYFERRWNQWRVDGRQGLYIFVHYTTIYQSAKHPHSS